MTKTKNPKARRTISAVSRVSVKPSTKLKLYVRAGGRCEFDGCNTYLLAHPLTLDEGNYAQMGHIVAYKEKGPRGHADRPADINDVENLMLLCGPCHRLIDKEQPDQYDRETLEKFKQDHERRIFQLTATKPDRKTTIVQLKSRIGGHVVAIPAADVRQAVAPRFPDDPRGYIIDLTAVRGEDAAAYRVAANTIKQEVQRLYAPGMEVESTRHISLFALAPIPLLVYLGRQLSNKVPVDPYQRHRDTEDWAWKKRGKAVNYKFGVLRKGSDPLKVALLISLSGKLDESDLAKSIGTTFTLYEMTLAEKIPNPTFLRLRDDLTRFRIAYQEALAEIMKTHPGLKEIHFFPAVPAPVAVLCGRELLTKVHPSLLVYDNDKSTKGFKLALKVNNHD
jgi:hypothetical protein